MTTAGGVTRGGALAPTTKAQATPIGPDELLKQLKRMLEAEVAGATDKNGKIDYGKLSPIFQDAQETKGWKPKNRDAPTKDELVARAYAMAELQVTDKNKGNLAEISPSEVKGIGRSQASVGNYVAAAMRASPLSGANILASLETKIAADVKAGGKGPLFDEARDELKGKGIKTPTDAQLSEMALKLAAGRLPKGDVSADQIAKIGAKDPHIAPYLESAYIGAGGTKTALNEAAKALRTAGEVTDTQRQVAAQASKSQSSLGYGEVEAAAITKSVTRKIDSSGEPITGDSMRDIFAKAQADGVDRGKLIDHLMDADGTVAGRLSKESLVVIQENMTGKATEGADGTRRADRLEELAHSAIPAKDWSQDPATQLRLAAQNDTLTPKEQTQITDPGMQAAATAARSENGGKPPKVDQVLAKYAELQASDIEAQLRAAAQKDGKFSKTDIEKLPDGPLKTAAVEARKANGDKAPTVEQVLAKHDELEASGGLPPTGTTGQVSNEVEAKINDLVRSSDVGQYMTAEQMDQLIERAAAQGISPEQLVDHLIQTTHAAEGGGAAQQGQVGPQGDYSPLGQVMTADALTQLASRLKRPETQEEHAAFQERMSGLQGLQFPSNPLDVAQGQGMSDAERARALSMGLSPTEMGILDQITDPNQRAMQMMQMYQQHQAFLATMLTNLAQMRHDMLKAVAQNLRA